MNPKDYWQKHARMFAGLYENPNWFNRIFRQAMYLRTEMAVEEIKATPNATVLAVGCGPGRNSVLFVKKAGASRVVGVDLSQNMIDMANTLASQHGVESNCRFIQSDFMDVDLGEERFDYSIALGVMDYIRDPLPMLVKMRSLTAKAAMATFPGGAPLRMTLRKIRYRLRGCGVYSYRASRIKALFREAGFSECSLLPCANAGWLGVGRVAPT
ncbi:hypothetical protein LCGC14_0181420 [marine sediment metagenome]|uniref:Methyltransferase domain-containing protein n=1 Tax=marine sediment metagenome TaxID=412755 RepID=A0A0F9UTP5_9ZZZZ|nr:class I SAM-dependent methyltransferase [Phycisphaerae bacterium]HDZ44398.1 class I SAM-dependent methyltransferase [Phycisphaerae bacterium]